MATMDKIIALNNYFHTSYANAQNLWKNKQINDEIITRWTICAMEQNFHL